MGIVNESNRKPIKLWLNQEENFTINLWKINSDNVLMYSTHNKGESVIAESFIKILKAKITKIITANHSKPYHSYLKKLLDQYNNAYHRSVNNKPIIADYFVFTENAETNRKTPQFNRNGPLR